MLFTIYVHNFFGRFPFFSKNVVISLYRRQYKTYELTGCCVVIKSCVVVRLLKFKSSNDINTTAAKFVLIILII